MKILYATAILISSQVIATINSGSESEQPPILRYTAASGSAESNRPTVRFAGSIDLPKASDDKKSSDLGSPYSSGSVLFGPSSDDDDDELLGQFERLRLDADQPRQTIFDNDHRVGDIRPRSPSSDCYDGEATMYPPNLVIEIPEPEKPLVIAALMASDRDGALQPGDQQEPHIKK